MIYLLQPDELANKYVLKEEFLMFKRIIGLTFVALFFTVVSVYADDRTFEQRVFELVNAERAAHGLSALQWDDRLAAAALSHSHDLADTNMGLSHVGSDGSTVADRLVRYGVGHNGAAENIIAGTRTPEAVVRGLMQSPGHRANILNTQMTHIGVGHYDWHGTRFCTYTTMKFARNVRHITPVNNRLPFSEPPTLNEYSSSVFATDQSRVTFSGLQTYWRGSGGSNHLIFEFVFNAPVEITHVGIYGTGTCGLFFGNQAVVPVGEDIAFPSNFAMTSGIDVARHFIFGETYTWIAYIVINGRRYESEHYSFTHTDPTNSNVHGTIATGAGFTRSPLDGGTVEFVPMGGLSLTLSTLQATAAPGWTFVGWFDGDTLVCTRPTYTFARTLANNTNVFLTARFTNPQHEQFLADMRNWEENQKRRREEEALQREVDARRREEAAQREAEARRLENELRQIEEEIRQREEINKILRELDEQRRWENEHSTTPTPILTPHERALHCCDHCSWNARNPSQRDDEFAWMMNPNPWGRGCHGWSAQRQGGVIYASDIPIVHFSNLRAFWDERGFVLAYDHHVPQGVVQQSGVGWSAMLDRRTGRYMASGGVSTLPGVWPSSGITSFYNPWTLESDPTRGHWQFGEIYYFWGWMIVDGVRIVSDRVPFTFTQRP
jgi:hypothetical protein